MEQENMIEHPNHKIRNRLIASLIVFGIIFIIGILFTVLSMISPLRAIDQINSEFKGDSSQIEQLKTGRFKQEKDMAFLESRIAMAKSDSVCLSVNLEDSLLMLELEGVVIHTAKIQHYRISKLFSKINTNAFVNYYNSPFEVENSYSTLPKEAYVIKIAPSDTSQMQAPEAVPDTSVHETACFTLYLNKNLEVDIRQSDNHNQRAYKLYNRHLKLEKITEMLSHLIRFQVPDYIPKLQIEISEKDAKSIFRALPVHSEVSIRL